MNEAQVMENAMSEARKATAELIERRVKGIQRVLARKDREIAELRRRLAEQEEAINNG